jgi:hypothetical protein
LVENSMTRSVWAITSGGEGESSSAAKNRLTGKIESIFTRALVDSLDPENEQSIFKKGENIVNVLDLSSHLLKTMKFSIIGNMYLPLCGPLAKSPTPLNFAHKGIPLFSNSLHFFTLNIPKIICSQRKEQMKNIPFSDRLFRISSTDEKLLKELIKQYVLKVYINSKMETEKG